MSQSGSTFLSKWRTLLAGSSGERQMVFPTLQSECAREVNLNKVSLAWMRKKNGRVRRPSPLLDPGVAERALNDHCGVLGLKWSYGGYFEDRSDVWAGSYLDKTRSYLHLGVDFNAPAGTPVALDSRGEVLRIDDDTPLKGGWGNRVMFKLINQPLVLLYAHLSPQILCKKGDVVGTGKVFAHVGGPQDNGYWYPHVHVQALTMEAYKEFLKNSESLDGYGHPRDREELERKFPDPMPYVRVR